MIVKWLARPLLGAVIGYCTNYIAVKMLFRPLRPVTVWGHRLPFTPGIIPKGQERLANAVADIVGRELLTTEEIEKTLLSQPAKEAACGKIESWMQQQCENSAQLGQCLMTLTGGEMYLHGRETLQQEMIEHLTAKLGEADLGSLIAAQVIGAVKEKVSGSLLAMMLSDEMLASFSEPIALRINGYVAEHGQELLEPIVSEELEHWEHKTVGSLSTAVLGSGLEVSQIIANGYEALVCKLTKSALEVADIRGMVSRKIMQMHPEQLEQLVLSVMKKELTAVVNLGALIGFVLGLINLLF